MAAKQKFQASDLVFAKVRGFPPWPARIEDPAKIGKELPSNKYYHVFFYGTYETAVVQEENLFPYAEYKTTYGEPKKRKFFNEALEEIENKPEVIDSVVVPSKNEEKENRALNQQSEKQLKKTELKTAKHQDNQTKKHQKEIQIKPIKSRSGRVVKRKNFSEQWLCDTYSVQNKKCLSDSQYKKHVEENKNSNILNEEILEIKEKNLSDSEIVDKSENSAQKTDDCDEKCENQEKSMPKSSVTSSLKTDLEIKLCEIDLKIKSNLMYQKPNIQKCIAAMAELERIPIKVDILKVEKPIISTLKKCRNFVGSEVIRQKANFLYYKFKSAIIKSFESEKDIQECTVTTASVN